MKTITMKAIGFRIGVVDAVVQGAAIGLLVAMLLGLGLLAAMVLG